MIRSGQSQFECLVPLALKHTEVERTRRDCMVDRDGIVEIDEWID